MVVLAVFVDDVLIACANTHIIAEIKSMFKDHYTVTDMGVAKEFLGVRIIQGDRYTDSDQELYSGGY